MSGSMTDCMAPSMNGRSEYQPYFAASYARSRYSSVGPRLMKPPNGAADPGSPGNSGIPSRAKLTSAAPAPIPAGG